MEVRILAPAEAELFDAVAYYNGESEGLGYEFAAEARRTIARIIEHPNAWAPISKHTRRCRLNRFPYGILYQLRPDTILIVRSCTSAGSQKPGRNDSYPINPNLGSRGPIQDRTG